MSKLSDRINKMSESATLAMARLSRELKEQRKRYYNTKFRRTRF